MYTSTSYSNTAASQRNRILDFLQTGPLDTLTARKELDVMHPAARVMELKRSGKKIQTVKIDRASECGKIYRIACYVLEAGAGATTPADESAGNHRQGIDLTKHNTKGNQ